MTNARKHYFRIPFDPLKYVKALEAAGFSRQQAEVQAETFLSIVQEQLVRQQDLKEIEAELKRDISRVDVNLKQAEIKLTAHIKEVDAKLTAHIKEVEAGLTIHIKEVELGLRRDIKQLEHNMKEMDVGLKAQNEILRRDLKIWFGGMLISIVVTLSTTSTLIIRFMGQ